MEKQIAAFALQTKKSDVPVIKAGDTVRVSQRFKDGDKEKIQIFEGLVLAKKHGNETGATITVRKIVAGVGVEKLFPIHSPIISKIEVVRQSKVRRAKLNFMRTAKGKRAQLKIVNAKK